MDTLTIIFVLMTAILFGYGGYVLGNYYPLIKREKKDSNILLVEHEIEGEETNENEEGVLVKESEPAHEVIKRVIPQMMDPEDTIQVWYDVKNRKIVPEVKGQLLDLDGDIEEEEKQKLTWLLVDLQERVGLVSDVKKQISEAQGSDDKEVEASEVNFNPIKSFVNYIQADVPKIEEKTDSIPEQINTILQGQIDGTKMKEKGITVVELPGKGLVFMVGIDLYEDIEKIPNKNIQKVIKKAVKTWEEEYKLKD